MEAASSTPAGLEARLAALDSGELARHLQHAAWLLSIIESRKHSGIWPRLDELYHALEQAEEQGDHGAASVSRASYRFCHIPPVMVSAGCPMSGPTGIQIKRMGPPREQGQWMLLRSRPARYADGYWPRSCDSVGEELEMACRLKERRSALKVHVRLVGYETECNDFIDSSIHPFIHSFTRQD